MQKYVMNLKESKEGYVVGVGKMKWCDYIVIMGSFVFIF